MNTSMHTLIHRSMHRLINVHTRTLTHATKSHTRTHTHTRYIYTQIHVHTHISMYMYMIFFAGFFLFNCIRLSTLRFNNRQHGLSIWDSLTFGTPGKLNLRTFLLWNVHTSIKCTQARTLALITCATHYRSALPSMSIGPVIGSNGRVPTAIVNGQPVFSNSTDPFGGTLRQTISVGPVNFSPWLYAAVGFKGKTGEINAKAL